MPEIQKPRCHGALITLPAVGRVVISSFSIQDLHRSLALEFAKTAENLLVTTWKIQVLERTKFQSSTAIVGAVATFSLLLSGLFLVRRLLHSLSLFVQTTKEAKASFVALTKPCRSPFCSFTRSRCGSKSTSFRKSGEVKILAGRRGEYRGTDHLCRTIRHSSFLAAFHGSGGSWCEQLLQYSVNYRSTRWIHSPESIYSRT